MQMDELVLKLVTKVNDAKSSISSMINLTKNLDNTTSKTTQSFDKMANSTERSNNNFKDTKANITQLKSELNRLIRVYNEHIDIFKQWGNLATENMNFSATQSMSKEDIIKGEGAPINAESLKEELRTINDLKQTIKGLQEISKRPIEQNLIPKQVDTKSLDDTKKKTSNVNKEVTKTISLFKALSNASKSVATKGFDMLKNKFGGFSNSFGKGIANNINQLKKLALGLVGVRTVMSLLTKSVNAYLSFDSELQDSLNNSWNMLGSLLAPAIELVAQAFATATNYIYRFVQALTGIDLVARANAKAIETQAKKTKALGDAQRGLLSMDEITNLPTESKGSVANQIGIIDIKPDGMFNELIDAFKMKDWHLAGEIIGDGITKGLRKINWDVIREGAEQAGYNISTFLNGLFELDWHTIGSTIGNGINTAIDFAYGFVNEFEWGRLGAGIGDAITKFFETFDYNKLADSITKLAVGIFDLARASLVHFDVEAFGNDIISFLERIDWQKIGTALSKLLLEATFRAMQLGLVIFTRLGKDIRNMFEEKINKLGDRFGGAFGNGLKCALKGAINAIIDMINKLTAGSRGLVSILGAFTGHSVSLDQYKIPRLATGTPNIESEGLYHLHEGEMVVPKRYNPNTDGYNNGADNKQIIDLLVSLNASMLEYAERPINISMNGRQVAEASYNDFQEVGRNRNQSTAVTRS